MAEIVLVRQERVLVSEEDKTITKLTLFKYVDGLGDLNKKRWRKFFSKLFSLEEGECAVINFTSPRSNKYHGMHMAFEQKLFEMQEKFEHFEQFRNWLKIGAGFVDWVAGPKGGVVPLPKSISFINLEQSEYEMLHMSMIMFIREGHAQKVLWPHLSDLQRSEYVEIFLQGFEQWQKPR